MQTPLRPETRRVGRPTRSQHTADNWRDDALALLTERKVMRLGARALLPHARFVRAMAEDVQAEQAQAGVIVFLERIAGPKDAA